MKHIRFLIYINFLILLEFPIFSEPLKLDPENASRIACANYFLFASLENKTLAIQKLIAERWRNYLPSIGLGLIRQRYIIEDGQDSIMNEIRLNLEQIIYDGGRRSLDLDIARLEEILTKEELSILAARVSLEVKKNYFESIAEESKIRLIEKSLERARFQLSLANSELRLGFITKQQVLEIYSKEKEIELALTKARNQFKKSVNNLKLLLSLPGDTEFIFHGDLIKDYLIIIPEIQLEYLKNNSRANRIEIKKSKVQVFKAEKELEMAESAWIPKISVGGYLGRTGENFPLTKDAWGASVKITLPFGNNNGNMSSSTGVRPNSLASTGIRNDNLNFNNSTNGGFNLFDNMSQSRILMESKIRLGDSLAEKKRLEENISLEVERSADSFQESLESIKIANGELYYKYESLRLALMRLTLGQAKRAEILEKEIELIRSENTLIDSISRYIIVGTELEWASALEPGNLKHYKIIFGKGNSILSRIGNIPSPKIPDTKKEYLLEKYKPETQEEKNLLDKIELE